MGDVLCRYMYVCVWGVCICDIPIRLLMVFNNEMRNEGAAAISFASAATLFDQLYSICYYLEFVC